MVEQAAKTETPPVEKTGRAPKKKKSRPTNCAQSNKRIHRKDWYYRDGKYFANKKAHSLYVVDQAAKLEKEKTAAAAKAAETKETPST